ncbi:MAG: efflux RND transporter permease subunit, partial [Lachnospiraceae bacterium]|nr:efflux RND transporter permease subunit [Lachnospiraceae bacterium]
SGQEQIDSGWDAIADAKEQMEEGKKQLEDGAKQIKDGWDDFNDAVENYEKQKKETLRHANAEELVSINTLSALIYAQNFAMPAGYIDDQYDNSWLVKVGTSFKNLEELENIVLTNIKDIGDVKLSDVADVIQLDNADQSYARLDGENAIVLSIFKSSTSGTNEVSRNITKATEELKEQHPGLSILTMMDQGDYITMIINGVLQSMIVGSILAIVVLALFLKDVKPTLVVAISIPLSVLTALVLMYFTNISLNMMSLSGLGLGIGMLVDNSIVVIENIYRLRSRGVSAARAAVQGTNQVLGAIVASTLTTVSVFAPMVFSTGLVRELVMPISLTISYTLLASLIIAVTVVPAAGSTMLKNTKSVEHPLFDKILDVYEKALAYCLKVKVVPLTIAIGLLVFCIWQVLRMGIVMIPEMTSNQISVSVEMEEEMDRATCYETADEVLEKIMAVPGIESVGAMAGGETALFSSGSGSSNFKNYSFMIVTENPKAGKTEVKEICDAIVENTKDLSCEVNISTGMDEMSQMMGTGLSVSIYGPDLDQLREISEDLMEVVEGIEGFENISNGTEEADQVIHLTLDKDAAMRNGLTVAQIFQDLNTKISSEKTAATVTLDGVEMDIIVKDGREPLTKENLLDYTFEVSKTDDDNFNYTEDYPLGEFATIQMEDGFPNINRENQSRLMTVSATVKEGYNATLLARDLQPLLEDFEKEMPAGYTMNLGGESDSVNQMLIQMGKVIAMGLAFIYLVMVAQFQSLLSPFIVLFTVPLAFTGGLMGLLLLREPLSVMGMMGFTVLLGTVVNNGIVFVDYANQLRIGGLDRQTALIATGKTRMRPILMTALTTILAMSALLFGDDLASQMSKGMAIVVAGGLAYATLMTLFIIPVMYDILFKRKPIEVDLGSENLDDVPDDAAEYLQQQLQKQN